MDNDKIIFTLRQQEVHSPKFIASADVHLGKKLYNIPELEEDMRDNFVRLCDLTLEIKPEYLVLCGDLFEDNLPTAHTVSFVREQVKRLYDAGIRMTGIAGDHDKPIRGESWCNVSGIYPITICPNFAGFDYYNTSSGMANVMAALLENRNREEVQWIFLHCQFPQFFTFIDEKKRVDFAEVEVINEFPKLQGVIAGDIHAANVEGDITEKGKTAYIGYTGSLGVTDIDEANDRSVIYCDGTCLRRIPIPMRRSYVKINFRGDDVAKFDASAHVAEHKDDKYRPIFCVHYDSDSEQYLTKIKPLYTVGHVRPHQVIKSKLTGQDEVVMSIRSEMKTAEKIDAALKECCAGDKEVYGLLSEILTSTNPRDVLDDFKTRAKL